MAGLTATIRRSFPVRLAQAYAKADAGHFAGALAFNMFISMFPLILGMLSILGLLLRDASLQQQVETSVVDFFPSDARTSLLAAMNGVRQHSGVLGLVGIAGMLWSGSNLFVSMEFALDRIFGAGDRGFLRKRAMALLMTVLFIVAVVGTVFVNAVMARLGSVPWLGAVTGAVVWILFLMVLYRIVPNRTFRLAQIWGGAVIAGVLMEVLTLLWPVYTALAHGFSAYGATFALFFLLATWLYFLCQLILLGAVANRMRLGPPPEAGAMASPDGGPVATDQARAVDEVAERI
ncbi:MAG: YihY/virulence factor BrkB family protein [Candidatus Dormibacteraeota bacterium]|nr:YihY/virulence factor BrkB family protein [Candidatus Dormibacteraeota bacterium]MBO0761279.1 YihY/virulence factor BrkB family protein [Candidatus Dormibacteraeota bacterium]